ncbi:MAG: porin family protein [Hyphomicrobiaceae bacterium]|nr:MAG: porin family protein [Hyphomicrobiaceae bacterium]
MNFTRALASVGLSALFATIAAGAASATDLKGDPLVKRAETYPSIPVPAPIPIPEAFNWYIRADIGYAFSANTPTISETGYSTAGLAFPASAYTNTSTFENDAGWTNYGHIGFGVGYQFSKWIRGDLTAEVRNQATHLRNSTYTYTSQAVAPGPRPIQLDVSDDIKQRDYLTMANLYVDIPIHARFTPYLGVGIGLVAHDINRQYSETQTDNTVLPGTQVFTGTNKSRHTEYNFAWALMAGASIDLSTGTTLDLGYRYLHLEGASISNSRPSSPADVDLIQGGESSLKVGEQDVHEIRAGIRWKIW